MRIRRCVKEQLVVQPLARKIHDGQKHIRSVQGSDTGAQDPPSICSHSACTARPVHTDVRVMSASLIGRLGSSAFRLSAITVPMSLAGSCFSSESAPWPFHHGIRRRGGTIFTAALPDERQVQADIRTHLIHRPARDIFPRLGGIRVFSYRIWLPASLMLLRPLGSTGTQCRQPKCGA
jgi:hypothetical protein